MNLTKCEIFKYSLPLIHPLTIKGESFSVREGLILAVSVNEYVGYGEIAPLAGFSAETLGQAEEQIKKVIPFLLEDEVPPEIEDLQQGFANWLGSLELLPSVNFGIEMAILNLKANIAGCSLRQLLTEQTHDQIPINGLLLGSSKDAVDQAENLVKAGFHAFKLKVGGRPVDEDIELVKEVISAIEGKALLHLDANQQWSFDEAVHFGKEVGLTHIDYIEEPFAETEKIPDFFAATLIPVALDESLAKTPFDKVKSIEGVDVFVLKPSRLGGIERTWNFVRESKRLAFDTLISSIFESSIGLTTLANLAGCSFRNSAAGLDTAKWFKEDLLIDPLVIDHGKFHLKDHSLKASDIDFDRLIPVA